MKNLSTIELLEMQDFLDRLCYQAHVTAEAYEELSQTIEFEINKLTDSD